jgi:hypothetical protein
MLMYCDVWRGRNVLRDGVELLDSVGWAFLYGDVIDFIVVYVVCNGMLERRWVCFFT